MPSDAQQVWPFPQKHTQEGEMWIYMFEEGKKRNNKKKKRKKRRREGRDEHLLREVNKGNQNKAAWKIHPPLC